MPEAARKSEGFRYYYTLRENAGEENLRKFEKACAEMDVVPGIEEDGRWLS